MGILRDLALILLALEAAIGSLVMVALLVAVHYGLYRSRWWRVLPRWLLTVRQYLVLGQRGVEQVSRRAAAPILTVASARAALASILRCRR